MPRSLISLSRKSGLNNSPTLQQVQHAASRPRQAHSVPVNKHVRRSPKLARIKLLQLGYYGNVQLVGGSIYTQDANHTPGIEHEQPVTVIDAEPSRSAVEG